MKNFNNFTNWLTSIGRRLNQKTLGKKTGFQWEYDSVSNEITITTKRYRRQYTGTIQQLWVIYIRYCWLGIFNTGKYQLKTGSYTAGGNPNNWASHNGNPNTILSPYVAALLADWDGLTAQSPSIRVSPHFVVLHSIPIKKQGAVGKSPLSFAKTIGYKSSKLPPKKMTRDDIVAFCKSTTNLLDKFVVIMAWGGSRIDHMQMLIKAHVEVAEFMTAIQKSKSRIEAFSIYQDFRTKGKLRGLGISFATKVIYFLMHAKPHGYILDQWTAKSMTLLSPAKCIPISSAGLPLPTITPLDYEDFCKFIESLAKSLGCTPDEAETHIFSEGRGKGVWREHLKKYV